MTMINESAHKHATATLKEMHEMADLLMHPPDFQSRLELYSQQPPTPSEKEEFDKLLERYQEMARTGEDED